MSSSDYSSDDEQPKKKVEEKKKGKKRGASEDVEEKPEKNEAKKTKNDDKDKPEIGKIKDDAGNDMFEFGNLRYASVSNFKGKQYLNIREYYMDKNTGKMMPSKKGISLTKPQWNALKDLIPILDKKF
ncbi:unnamed protein product [Caenorhabditis bovis]|uniref:Transcriptional coactivator p15 (PC4) C-terminal domain-containing protein n=1 Tax=Caenorhabditis bovis TaxID=2654633 RepID=A0A8S1FE27_9PELO|nr:unnamed protein product [Caenorhabditis bovis]